MTKVVSPGVAGFAGLALATIICFYFYRKKSTPCSSPKKIPTRWRRVGKLGAIYCYPVKSCKPVKLEDADLKKNGVHYPNGRDRAFVVVDRDGNVVSCKTRPCMWLIEASVQDNKLTLKKPDMDDITVDLVDAVNLNVRLTAQFFKHLAPGVDMGDEMSEWLEKAILADQPPEVLEKMCPLRLMYMPPDLGRSMKQHEKTLPNFDSSHMVNYAGVTSYMVLGEGSLKELNDRLAPSSIDERPFRPNLFIHQSKPYEENKWEFLRIGDAVFSKSITCTRCPIVNEDPDTGTVRTGTKPLDVLRKYRKEKDPGTIKFKEKQEHGPILGNYFQICVEGEVSVGYEVYASP